jgi:serine/threonine-protein kinase HipA
MEHSAIVFIDIKGKPVPAGRIRIIEDGRYSTSQFMYGRKYLEREDAVALDPVQLPLQSGVIEAPEDFLLFNGIRDAAPDAWGRSLIDKYMLRKFGRGASEAEFLLASQSGTRIGGLRFGSTPNRPGNALGFSLPEFSPNLGDLDQFQCLVDHIYQDTEPDEHLMDFVSPGSDLGGARPKGTVMIDGFPWLAKFGKQADRISMAGAEAGCLDLCEMAGLDVCERRIETISGRPTLLLKRFDRYVSDDMQLHRKHMVSSLTLLGAHEHDRGASGYADIYSAMRRFGQSASGEDLYRRMVMNVLCGNTDDHYRNHGFLMNEDGRFTPSPVYDVTPSLAISTTRSMFLHLGKAGAGRTATLQAAVDGAASLGVRYDDAVDIANQLSEMVAANWERVMTERGCSVSDIQLMANSFSEAGQKITGPGADQSCTY